MPYRHVTAACQSSCNYWHHPITGSLQTKIVRGPPEDLHWISGGLKRWVVGYCCFFVLLWYICFFVFQELNSFIHWKCNKTPSIRVKALCTKPSFTFRGWKPLFSGVHLLKWFDRNRKIVSHTCELHIVSIGIQPLNVNCVVHTKHFTCPRMHQYVIDWIIWILYMDWFLYFYKWLIKWNIDFNIYGKSTGSLFSDSCRLLPWCKSIEKWLLLAWHCLNSHKLSTSGISCC